MKTNANKTLLLYFVLLFIVVFLIFILVYNFKLTKLERIKIEEFNKNSGVFIDEYIDQDDKGKYVIFAVEYLNSKTNRTDYTIKEVIDTINNTFDQNYTKKTLYKLGITERMLDKGIVFDDTNEKYIYKNQKTRSDIANEKIIKYHLKKIKKTSKNRFILTYDKYEVDDPYKILNYYNGLGSNKNDSKNSEIIVSYLKGSGNLKDVKNIINEDNIKDFGKISGHKKITLKIKNDKLIISKVK